MNIRDKVEILSFNYLNDLVQLCVRVKEQIKRKSTFRNYYTSSPIKKEYFRENRYLRGKKDRPREKEREQENQRDHDKSNEKYSYKEIRGKNIQCFKFLEKGHCSSECLSQRRNMILREQKISLQTQSYSSSNEEETTTFEETPPSEEEIQPCTEELLVVKKILNSTPLELEESQ